MEGDPAPVMPDEIRCLDDRTLEQCEGYQWEQRSCDGVCRDTHGVEWYSLGCDVSAEDPCQCQYAIDDGDMAFCEPGALLRCVDENTVERCDDAQVQDCDDLCREDYGDFYESQGCDVHREGNMCGCYPSVDGGMPAM